MQFLEMLGRGGGGGHGAGRAQAAAAEIRPLGPLLPQRSAAQLRRHHRELLQQRHRPPWKRRFRGRGWVLPTRNAHPLHRRHGGSAARESLRERSRAPRRPGESCESSGAPLPAAVQDLRIHSARVSGDRHSGRDFVDPRDWQRGRLSPGPRPQCRAGAAVHAGGCSSARKAHLPEVTRRGVRFCAGKHWSESERLGLVSLCVWTSSHCHSTFGSPLTSLVRVLTKC